MSQENSGKEIQKEKENLSTVSFWEYFSSLIDVLKLNNRTI
jgi:hypothetical protein